MDKQKKLYIAGHTGTIGSAIFRKYKREGYTSIVTKTHEELNLLHQKDVTDFFEKEKPEYVIVASGRIGGIKDNMEYPAEFMYENLTIQNNSIWSAFKNDVEKLLYISCGCAYPTQATQPIKEEYLLSGVPEPTNEGFAIAKIAGIKLCEKINIEYKKNFISCIPANTYGENDHFDDDKSHVISALIKRFHEAKKNNTPSVILWGTGVAKREFIYVDDIADAVYLLMEKYDQPQVINIGSGEETSIKELAEILKNIVGYKGAITFDTSKPDGMLARLLDSSKIQKLGFKSKTALHEGLEKTYQYYLKNLSSPA